MNKKLTPSSFSKVTLVVFYGGMSSKLILLSHKIQEYLSNIELLREKFVPYKLEQIHGTIVGCEGFKTKEGVINKWFYEYNSQVKYIDFDWISYLQTSDKFPITLRFGGYDSEVDYGFLSRGIHPAVRSFQLQLIGEEIVPVLIGWSFRGGGISSELDNLRRDAQKFNLLHKYYSTPEAVDNDFYLRLGTIKDKLPSSTMAAIASQVRDRFLKHSSLYVSLDKSDLAFATYRDKELTPATTRLYPLMETTISQIQQLYLRC